MKIRLAEPDDMPRLIEMGLEFLQATPRYRDMVPGDPEAMRRFFYELMSLPSESGLFLVLGEPGEAHGMLAGIVLVHHLSSIKWAREMFWWVDPKRRGGGMTLMRTFFDWCDYTGAKRIELTSPSKKVSRLYRKLGFQPLEQTYIKKVA